MKIYAWTLCVLVGTGQAMGQSGALIRAAENADVAVVSSLLSSGADPNEVDNSVVRGRTPLMAAAETGCPDVVRLLLDSHANINATNEYGATALDIAVTSGGPTSPVAVLIAAAGGRGKSGLEWRVKAALEAVAAMQGAAATEECEWNRSLRLNSEEAYVNFYKRFPNTKRMAILEGTLEGEIDAQWRDNIFSQLVHLKMNGADLDSIRLEEAEGWHLLDRADQEFAETLERHHPSRAAVTRRSLRVFPDSTIVMLKEPDRIVGINTGPSAEEQARQKLDPLVSGSLEGFLKAFPAGRHTNEARRVIVLEGELRGASRLDTLSAYREFLALFKSDSEEALSDSPVAPCARLYWAARAKIERLAIAEIDKKGVGQRFCLKDLQPEEEGRTGSITVMEDKQLPGYLRLSTLYPGDLLDFALTPTGANFAGPPRGSRSIIRFAGTVSVGEGSVKGDRKEPLSFILLKPYGAVYLDGRGTVTTGGKSVSLPPSPAPRSRKAK